MVEKEGLHLDAADFNITIDEETKEITVEECPELEAHLDLGRSEKTGKVNVYFDADKYEECPLKGRCPVKIEKNIATMTIDNLMYVQPLRLHQLSLINQYMGDTDYRKECAVRSGEDDLVNSKSKCSWNEKGKTPKVDSNKNGAVKRA